MLIWKFENIVHDYKIFKKSSYNSDRFCNCFLSLIDYNRLKIIANGTINQLVRIKWPPLPDLDSTICYIDH